MTKPIMREGLARAASHEATVRPSEHPDAITKDGATFCPFHPYRVMHSHIVQVRGKDHLAYYCSIGGGLWDMNGRSIDLATGEVRGKERRHVHLVSR